MAIYVNNAEFYALLVEYNETGSRKAYNEIGKIFLLIAQRMLNKPSFLNRTDDRKQEMVSDATMLCVRYIKSFNTKYTNPFAYFSQIAYNSFRNYVNLEKEHAELFTSIEYLTSKDSMDSSNNYVADDN